MITATEKSIETAQTGQDQPKSMDFWAAIRYIEWIGA